MGNNMDRYRCTVCSHLYDPALGDPGAGSPPEVAFYDLPEDWVCPECGVGKD
jgi:rubredoxin